jgi:hypothetical protein
MFSEHVTDRQPWYQTAWDVIGGWAFALAYGLVEGARWIWQRFKDE